VSDMTVSSISTAKVVLHEIATHAYNLGMGLQNAAPSQAQTGTSIQYLKEISVKLDDTSKKIDELISNNQK
jgi:hypothetical protein